MVNLSGKMHIKYYYLLLIICFFLLLFNLFICYGLTDDSKFGQKLMEKMGWSKGKGLGINEDGNTEHVAVKVKNDTRGRGQ